MDLFTLLQAHRGDSNIVSPLALANHPATHLLRHLGTHGAPVVLTSAPWPIHQRDAAMARGPHASAHQHAPFLRDELADMIDRGTWLVLPYRSLRHHPSLRISPMGVVPQHERRPRPIVDYSFSGLNSDTLPLSPPEAMQFGRTLDRLLHQIVHSNPKHGPVHLIKLDIADGFYRVWLKLADIPKLAVAIPSLPHEPPLVALPLALPMGWTQSPPYFSAVTETIADLANLRIRQRRRAPLHRLDHLADTPATDIVTLPPRPHQPACVTPTPPPNPNLRFHARRLATVDVFVDDFIAAAQGPRTTLSNLRRTLMHAIDAVFRPLTPHDPPLRTEPISVSKLLKGDACWSTCKKILGWIVDTVSMTITLPARRLQRLHDLLAAIPATRKRMSLSTYHQMLGELRSMALALPGARGLFSHLQTALKSCTANRLRLTPRFHHALDDFRWLYHELRARPTRLQELVPTTPCLWGTHDAAGSGAGGVWFPTSNSVPRAIKLTVLEPSGHLHRTRQQKAGPIVWRVPFPTHIRANLASSANPHGPINNSQLELIGAFLHDDAAAQCFDVRERTIHSRTDNLCTLYWDRKGSVTTTSPTATILRQQALHQRFHRYVKLRDYIPGPDNVMADDASPVSAAPPVALVHTPPGDDFYRDLRLASHEVSRGVVPSRSREALAHWRKWVHFCDLNNISPHLDNVHDPIPYLQVFAYRFRHGHLNTSQREVRSRTVENALRSVGQTLAAMGAPDPRYTATGKIDFRLQRMLAAYRKIDHPPLRVKPIPVPILRHIALQANLAPSDGEMACADMICLAFFFLLRPGEYTGTTSDTQPFHLQNVTLFVGPTRLDTLTADPTRFATATFVTLEFTTQKNSVRGECIGLGRSGDPHFCPVMAAARRVAHLRSNHATPHQPLASYFHLPTHTFRRITPQDITSTLRLATLLLGPAYGFLPENVSARSLRASGAMALLCADVDSDRIQLIGRWRSDEMMRYLHVQAEPVMRDFASRMLRGGHFTLLPNQTVPPR